MDKIKPERKKPSQNHGAMEKCQAVLSVWTERRKPSVVCRELQVPWMVLTQWQKRAMEGMLQALEPRVRLENGPALSLRLQKMLERNRQVHTPQSKLDKMLARAQQARSAGRPSSKDQKPESPGPQKAEKP